MTTTTNPTLALKSIDNEVLADLIQRVQDIDNSYRAVAEKMGQLYLRAEEHEVEVLTRTLDKPMRNASENEQTFAAILDELRMLANQRR